MLKEHKGQLLRLLVKMVCSQISEQPAHPVMQKYLMRVRSMPASRQSVKLTQRKLQKTSAKKSPWKLPGRWLICLVSARDV